MSDLEERLANAVDAARTELDHIESVAMSVTCPKCGHDHETTGHVLAEVKAHLDAVLEDVRRDRILSGQPTLHGLPT